MYNATLYLNTGFNAVNIPDKVSTLRLAPYMTVPALDIYQARELSQFRIKVNDYSAIRDADYLQLVNTADDKDFAFYSIQRITMTSMDVATLDVTMDYFLTAGGVDNLDFTDGMCERHHIAKSDDAFGKYDEEDPYLTPAEMLKIETELPEFDDPNVPLDTQNDVFIESTVDLYQMYVDCHSGAGEGIDYTSLGNNTVTVPTVAAAQQGTAAAMTKSDGYYYSTYMPNVLFYTDSLQFNDITIRGWLPDALKYIRSLGVDSCIIAQYAIPHFMVKDTDIAIVHTGEVSELIGSRVTRDLTTLPFKRSYNGYSVQNMRLYYGENTKYTIVSLASGNSGNFLPEEICDNDQYPTVEMRVDPRPKGCPYFRFDYYRGQSVYTADSMFFTNAIKGLEWQNVPLLYEGASGSLLNQYKYDATMARNELKYQYGSAVNEQNATKDFYNSVLGTAGNIISAISDPSNAAGYLGNAAEGVVNQVFNQTMALTNAGNIYADYQITKSSELQALLAQNNVVAPSMNFPISEGIRDYVGNTCLVYRTYYSDNDIRRLDKILNMYGYRHTTPITKQLLTNRSKFNYIQAKGVSIKNTKIPKWIRDGVAAQLSVGTRIWHQLPDTNCYTDGTNI